MERKGICRNVGVCSQANKVQIITDDDAEFVCPECGSELEPAKDEAITATPNKKSWLKPAAICIAALAILGGLGYGGYALYDSHQKSEQEKAQALAAAKEAAEEAQAQLEQKEREEAERAEQEAAAAAANAEEQARRDAIVAAAKVKGDSIITANEKLLAEKAKKIRDDAKTVINAQLTSLRTACQTLQYENVTLIDTMEVALNDSWKNAEKSTGTGGGAGKKDLGYGIYEGPMSGGQPNGVGGTIRFTRSYTIDLKKASGEAVNVSAGDVLNNVKMENGRIIQGQLKRTDGSQRWIIIG